MGNSVESKELYEFKKIDIENDLRSFKDQLKAEFSFLNNIKNYVNKKNEKIRGNLKYIESCIPEIEEKLKEYNESVKKNNTSKECEKAYLELEKILTDILSRPELELGFDTEKKYKFVIEFRDKIKTAAKGYNDYHRDCGKK